MRKVTCDVDPSLLLSIFACVCVSLLYYSASLRDVYETAKDKQQKKKKKKKVEEIYREQRKPVQALQISTSCCVFLLSCSPV